MEEMQEDIEARSRVMWTRLEEEPRKSPKIRRLENRDGQEEFWINEE